MTFKAHVENGAIIPDEGVHLEDGMVLEFAIVESASPAPGNLVEARQEMIRRFAGIIKDMPEDWSENHDKYLRESIQP